MPSTQGFLQGLLMQAPSAWHIPRCQTPGGEWVLNVTHVVGTNNLGSVNHCYQGTVETILKFQFPGASHGPALQASLSTDSSLRPAALTLPAHEEPDGKDEEEGEFG